MSLYFHEFREFCSGRKIKFCESIAMPHLLYCTHRSFAKIFFMQLSKLPFSRKFSNAKISQNIYHNYDASFCSLTVLLWYFVSSNCAIFTGSLVLSEVNVYLNIIINKFSIVTTHYHCFVK